MEYLPLVKAKEAAARFGTYHSRDLSEMEKQAMWNSFFDELEKISFDETAKRQAKTFFEKISRKLSSEARNALPSSSFVFPKSRRYPIEDTSHAENALARASGKPEESKVRADVHASFPNIGKTKSSSLGSWGAKKVDAVGRRLGRGVVEEAKAEGKKYIPRLAAIGVGVPAAAGIGAYAGSRSALASKEKKQELKEKVSTSTAAADERWEYPNDSFIQRHGKKILKGGLALALGAGVGHKLYKHPKVQAHIRVRRRIKDWKSEGGFKGKGPVREVVVNDPTSSDVPGQIARKAEAKIRRTPTIEVNKHDVAHAELEGFEDLKELKEDAKITTTGLHKGVNNGRKKGHLIPKEKEALERERGWVKQFNESRRRNS